MHNSAKTAPVSAGHVYVIVLVLSDLTWEGLVLQRANHNSVQYIFQAGGGMSILSSI